MNAKNEGNRTECTVDDPVFRQWQTGASRSRPLVGSSGLWSILSNIFLANMSKYTKADMFQPMILIITITLSILDNIQAGLLEEAAVNCPGWLNPQHKPSNPVNIDTTIEFDRFMDLTDANEM